MFKVHYLSCRHNYAAVLNLEMNPIVKVIHFENHFQKLQMLIPGDEAIIIIIIITIITFIK